MARGKRRKGPKLQLKPDTIFSIAAVVMIFLGALVVVSFSGQGEFLSLVNNYMTSEFGAAALLFPFIFVACGLVLFQTKWSWSKPSILLGALLLNLAVLGGGQTGVMGRNTFKNVAALISPAGSYILFLAIGVCGLLILLQISVADILELIAHAWPQPKFKPEKPKSVKAETEVEMVGSVSEEPKGKSGWQLPWSNKNGAKEKGEIPDILAQKNPSSLPLNSPNLAKAAHDQPAAAPKPLSLDKALDRNLLVKKAAEAKPAAGTDDTPMIWEYPPLKLLSDKSGGEANRGDVKANAAIIEKTLGSFGIKARVAEVNYGPAVTQYALEIALGTKLSRITGLATDLALALAAPTGQIRIEAPIAGKSLVGIEVPNHSAQFVTLRTMLQSDFMKKNPSKLAVALGLDVSGKPIVADIARMPHILIAGATGSGKSVAINTFICSILFRASPSEVKFIFVDPKRVELTGYNDIPHLLTPVIVEPAKVVSALKWATHEMDERYKKLAEVGVKNIAGYNELAGFQAMPNIVIIIDELADIMLFAPSEVEESVTRIAQMARAVGIHLVLATQRPSVDVITGLIKANIPARIAFNVSSMMDSRVILDTPGAEKLLGRGDMLFTPPDQAKPSRIQGTFVSEGEIHRLVDFVKAQGQKPVYEEAITTKYQVNVIKGGGGGSGGTEVDGKDPLFDDTVKLFSQYDKASSSLIQRRLSVGYARAARILDQLYEAGLVGPAEGSKPREVNLTRVREYLGGG